MERGSFPIILPVFLVLACTFPAGCLSGPAYPAALPQTTVTFPPSSPAQDSPVATIPASDMALQPADMPSGYILRDRTTLAYGGISQINRDLGWRQGYLVSYYRLDKEMDDTTSIVQEIQIYPLENINEVYSLEKDELLPPDDSTTDYQIPFPRLGGQSVAWRKLTTGRFTTTVTYTVIFTGKNVYEKISMTGTTTDYEVLKSVARTAEARIR